VGATSGGVAGGNEGQTPAAGREEGQAQLSLGLAASGDAPSAAERGVLDALREVDPDRITPLDALALLHTLRDRMRGDE
jgi:hypothetical protein